MGDLSPHFSKKELACPHCGKAPIDLMLLSGLEHLRALSQKAIHILSGYRCPQHNQQVGGQSNSMHIVGKAADVQIDQLDALATLRLVQQVPQFTGYGLYVAEHFVHVDTRPPVSIGHIATWGRLTANGSYGTLEQAIKEWERLHGHHQKP